MQLAIKSEKIYIINFYIDEILKILNFKISVHGPFKICPKAKLSFYVTSLEILWGEKALIQ